jgi:two-component system CheB/CheR fusion protein
MPYRTQDDRIDGVVITFVEITVAKTLEARLHEALSVLQSRFSDQTAELDAARTLEKVLQKAQAVLEGNLADQTAELRQSRADLHKEQERKT